MARTFAMAWLTSATAEYSGIQVIGVWRYPATDMEFLSIGEAG